MKNILDKIVHKLWMVDHHEHLPDMEMRDINKKIHFSWLRENLEELEVNSDHINFDNLREFAIETLFKNGFIYSYNSSCSKCLIPVKKDQSKKMGLSAVPTIKDDPEIFCDTRDFAAETLKKNGTVANLAKVSVDRDAILNDLENMCIMRDFAAETLPKNGIKDDFNADTLSDPNFKQIIKPETMAVFIIGADVRVDTLISPFSEPDNNAIFNQITSGTDILKNKICGKTDHAFFPPNKYHIFEWSHFLLRFFCHIFFNFNFLKFFNQFCQILTKFNSSVNINLGGRGHRFMMTLESRISRFK
jgi:hypothetical protein